jgi:WD40 repeat protein
VRFSGDANRFSHDGRRLVSRVGSRVNIWEVARSREYRTLPWSPVTGRESVRGGGLSRDGRWLTVAAGDGFRLWDLDSEGSLARLPSTYAVMAAFHPSGRELFTSGRGGLYRWPWYAEAGLLRIGPPRKLPIAGLLERISLDAEGRILAVARLGTSTGGASVVDLQSPTTTARHLTHPMAVSAAVSPDGRWIATGVHGGSGVRVWETRSGELVRELVPNYLDTLVTFSPDGRWLATGHAGVLAIWEAGSWRQVHQLKEQGGDNIPYAAFTADGKLLAVTISPSRTELVDTATWRPLARLQGPDSDSVVLLGFTPDGTKLVVAREAGGVRVWDLRRVRRQLKDVGLEWDAPVFPPQTRPVEARPLRVQVDLSPLDHGRPK